MGGGGGFLGLGGSKKPDTSAYERQLAEQRAATEKAEKEAAELKASQNAAEERRKAGRGSLLAHESTPSLHGLSCQQPGSS